MVFADDPSPLRGESPVDFGVTGWTGAGDKSGVFGHSQVGRGLLGRSDTNDGVVGWSGGGENKSGVFWHTQNGVGVKGRSDNNDGVVGWTGGGNKSGVFGHSKGGIGVTGMSEYNDGLVGVTNSEAPGHAGLRARNEGGGPAIFCEGDLFITGRFRSATKDITFTDKIHGPSYLPLVGPWGGGPRTVQWEYHLKPVFTIDKSTGTLTNSTGADGWGKINHPHVTKESIIMVTPRGTAFVTGVFVRENGSFWVWIPNGRRVSFLIIN
jgi:hypothetical protein